MKAPVLAAPAETERLGETLAPHLRVGDVVALCGPLGAGKTRFVAGLARGLGVKARVRSPSFTLIHEYDGSLRLYHLDLYRIETPAEIEGLGLEEAVGRGALAVEWGDRLPASFLVDALRLDFEVLDESSRRVTARAAGARGRELLLAAGL